MIDEIRPALVPCACWNAGRKIVGDQADDLLSATEAARYLKLPSSSQLRRVALATGMGRRIGHHWMFTKAELDAYAALRAQRQALGWQRVRGPVPATDAPAAVDTLLDINAAAERLGVSVKRVYQIADEGRLGTRHGTRWLFTPAELDAYRAATRRQGGRPRKRS